MEVWVAVLAGALAFIGSLVGTLLSRRASKELDVWRRREETMRMLRWSVEQATLDGLPGLVGVKSLESLGRSELLQAEDQGMIDDIMAVLLLANGTAEDAPSYTGSQEGGEQHVHSDDS